MILFSFKVCTYGKWYNPASGVLILLYAITKAVKKEETKINIISFLFIKFFLIKNKKGIKKNIVQMKIFSGKIKFINKAKKDKNIQPYIPFSGNVKLLSLKNKILNNLPYR